MSHSSVYGALGKWVNKPFKKLPRDLQTYATAYIPRWNELTPKERTDRAIEVDRQRGLKSKIKYDRAVRAQRAAPREPLQEARGWYNASLEADHWAVLGDIAPINAAMLLCQFNPNTETYDSAKLTTTDELKPEHLVRLTQRLADIDKAEHKPRTLRDWHQTARGLGLTYHSWIDGYMEATVPLNVTAQNPASPASVAVGGTFNPCAEFLAMEDIAASEVSIAFVGDKSEKGLGANSMLEISVRETKKRIALSSLNLIDKRKGTLNSQGAILLGMAGKKRLPNNSANVKRVERLRKALCDNLGIKGNPFEPFRKPEGWTPLFTLTDSRGAADKRAKEKAEFRQPSIEQMTALGRHIAAPEQPDDFIDRGDRANQRQKDYPADDWMRKNGHSYEDDDNDN